ESVIGLYRRGWREELRALRREAASESSPRLRHALLIEHAHWLARIGGEAHADEVLASLRDASTLPPAYGFRHQSGNALLGEAEALARIGRVHEAEAALLDWDLHHVPEYPWERFRRRVVAALLQGRAGET